MGEQEAVARDGLSRSRLRSVYERAKGESVVPEHSDSSTTPSSQPPHPPNTTMAPKLRRRKKAKAGRVSQHGPQVIGPPNSTGFASLPPELLLEIVSYLPRFPVPSWYLKSPMKTPTHTRQATLMVLVEVCRSFRHALVDYLWEEIILCSLHGGRMNTTANSGWLRHLCRSECCNSCERYLAYEIVAQLEIVTVRVPDYAQRVQTLSIFLPKYSATTMVPELARCLALMPNLKTLQLHHIYNDILDHAIQNAFSKYQYQNIQTLVVPCVRGSARILKACPNVCHLHFTSIQEPFYCLGDLPDTFPSVKKFTGIHPNYLIYDDNRTGFCLVLPNLKYVQVRTRGPSHTRALIDAHDHVETMLAGLLELEVIEIAIMHPKAEQEAEVLRESANSFLAEMPSVSGIRRRVEVWDYTTWSD
ncbi:hypothetical protein BDN72DRAFT_555996 [Pluteus cervinus]|uniref:Uncharacterized protein n=1 Tax=Pluteus cervinus TaxID=181527 RepID=A0ACD3B9R1_9AGAR|nr:hypothetical protein BDN72DRAFT_555996 [Pluteus cervinus]